MRATIYSTRKEGDMVFVSIINSNGTTIFKGGSNINDKKGLKNLIMELKLKGLNLKGETDWWD